MQRKPANARHRIIHEPEQRRQTALVSEPVHGVSAFRPDLWVRMLRTAQQHIHDECEITAFD
jgi:hypothetical protein